MAMSMSGSLGAAKSKSMNATATPSRTTTFSTHRSLWHTMAARAGRRQVGPVPHRVGRRLERARRLLQPALQVRHRREQRTARRPAGERRDGDVALEVRQHGATLVVGAEVAGGAVEPDGLEVVEEGVDGSGLRPPGPPHRRPDPHDGAARPHPAGQRLLDLGIRAHGAPTVARPPQCGGRLTEATIAERSDQEPIEAKRERRRYIAATDSTARAWVSACELDSVGPSSTMKATAPGSALLAQPAATPV